MLQTLEIAAEVDAIVEEFSALEDWTGRYRHLIDIGRALPGMNEAQKADAALIPSCIATVWLAIERHGDAVYFRADSDTQVVRGMIALLLRVYSGRRPDEILSIDADFLDRIDLGPQLANSRVNVLRAVVGRITAAAAYPPSIVPPPVGHASPGTF